MSAVGGAQPRRGQGAVRSGPMTASVKCSRWLMPVLPQPSNAHAQMVADLPFRWWWDRDQHIPGVVRCQRPGPRQARCSPSACRGALPPLWCRCWFRRPPRTEQSYGPDRVVDRFRGWTGPVGLTTRAVKMQLAPERGQPPDVGKEVVAPPGCRDQEDLAVRAGEVNILLMLPGSELQRRGAVEHVTRGGWSALVCAASSSISWRAWRVGSERRPGPRSKPPVAH